MSDGPKRILVADDESLMASGLAASLRGMKYEVVGPVSDGESAVKACIEHSVDLALLDIRMPVMDGLEAAATIWTEHRIPSVIVSAYSDDRYLSRATRTGVFGYLLKPVSTDNLRVTIAIAWSRSIDQFETRRRVDQLEGTLAQRKVVEQAKWCLVSKLGVSEPDAHSMMQKVARDERRKIVEVASDVLAGKLPPGNHNPPTSGQGYSLRNAPATEPKPHTPEPRD